MSMSIEALGLEVLAADLAHAATGIGSRVEEVRDETKSAIAETARGLAPERTGELIASIEETEDGVEANARHAPFVEHGTWKDAPQPFMDPAVDQHEEEFVNGVADAADL